MDVHPKYIDPRMASPQLFWKLGEIAKSKLFLLFLPEKRFLLHLKKRLKSFFDHVNTSDHVFTNEDSDL